MLLNNDIYSQFIDSTHKNKKLRENEVKKCNHAFILIDNNYIECYKCGLTNKYSLVKKEYGSLKEYINDECELFNKYCNINDFNQLEMIKTNHLHILYLLAKKLRPFSNKKKLLQIMKILNEIETDIEKDYTFDICDLYYLGKRFNDRTYSESSWSNDRIVSEIKEYADTLKVDVSELTLYDLESYFDYKISDNRIMRSLIDINERNNAFLKKIKDR